MLIYVDSPMNTGILEAQQRIIQADSDPRLSQRKTTTVMAWLPYRFLI